MSNLYEILGVDKDADKSTILMIEDVVYKKDEAPYESRDDAMIRRMSTFTTFANSY